MKYIFLTAITFFISVAGFTQKRYLYYFDKDLGSTAKSAAVFNGIGTYQNGVFELKFYNSRDSKLVMVEHYTDSALQVNDGMFQSYYSNGGLEYEGNFKNGKEDGLWKRRDETGRTIDSSFYNNGTKILEVHTGYYKNGALDSLIINNIKTDELETTFYNDKGEMLSHVTFHGQKGIVEYYDKGKLTSSENVNTREEHEASFPGGIAAWTQYISVQINKNIKSLLKDDRSGTCNIKFIVDKDGNIKDAKATSMQGSRLAEIALTAITSGPKWIPASQYGKLVNAYRVQPVTFTIQEDK